MATHLLVNGSSLAPETSEADQLAFRLALPAREIRLISDYACPADLSATDDRRRLGVALRGLRWRQGKKTLEVPIDSPAFIDGFHVVECYDDDAGSFRWTNGNAALPPVLLPRWRGEALLQILLIHERGPQIPVQPKPEAALMSAFENLGDNCELALAQRYYGVELPLTLLRWAGTSYEKLLRGLENRFSGIGDPGTTEVVWGTSDYRLQTPYFGFHTAANQKRDAAGVAEILNCGCAALRLLRRKLLQDIRDAKRIFVYKATNPAFGTAEMHALHKALRVTGPASLLCVTLDQSCRSDACVEQLGTGLYAGYLQKFVIPDGPFDEWLALCSRTLELHYGG
jgi:hypothetical protein